MRSRNMRQTVVSLFGITATLLAVVVAQTPVIGGVCKLGTADVQIGGKQTQFFLKCEPTSDSQNGEGVWVVKSRNAPAAPVENTQQNMAPPRKNPNICEQDNGARESDACAVSATCLQAHNGNPTSYLQCDQTTMRWMRKACQETFIFNFENQTCVVPRRGSSSVHRQQAPSGLVCTFTSCSNNNPCNSGTCNNGYCCSTGGAPAPIIVQSNPGCNGCQPQAAPMMAISTCPGGQYPIGNCNSGYCSPGYQCVSNSCCPQYGPPQQQIRVFSCPTGGNAVGACIAGSCATGYSCVQGNCCPARETKNPFVCPDGAQAVGGCVNGQCGAGYRCSNGLCCSGTSTTVKCLDGSEAVGACIPSCQGDACGRTTVSYYCGSGYTCTTGNICCPVNSCPDGGDPLGPTINGLCPTGYVAQGSICCSASLCADGSVAQPAINGQCPTTLTLVNGACCPSTNAAVECLDEVSIGPCVNGGCSGNVGYLCDTAQEKCCPVVDYSDPNTALGPAVAGLCPLSYAIVYTAAFPEGLCFSVQSIPNICAEELQSGPCNDVGACQAGFTCFVAGGVCCPNAVFRKLKPGNKGVLRAGGATRPTYGRPLHSYMPPRTMGGPMSCPDGTPAGGACMNGLCGVGHECIEGLCCLPQSKYGISQQGTQDLKSTCPGGDTAVSGCFADGTCGTGYECVKHMNLCCPPGSNISPSIPSGPSFPGQPATSVRPIGARCMQDIECVGNGEGLSMCHAGVCQCSPIAYSQGIACIRRRAMQMMMNDSPVMDSEVEKAVEKNLVASVPTA